MENARCLRRGMNLQQVERLMGGSCISAEPRPLMCVTRVWKATNLEIEVAFSTIEDYVYHDKLVDVLYHTPEMGLLWSNIDEVHLTDESLLDKLRGWLYR
jgi:hypothetical protein